MSGGRGFTERELQQLLADDSQPTEATKVSSNHSLFSLSLSSKHTHSLYTYTLYSITLYLYLFSFCLSFKFETEKDSLLFPSLSLSILPTNHHATHASTTQGASEEPQNNRTATTHTAKRETKDINHCS